MPAGSESAHSEAFRASGDAMGAKTGLRDSLEADLADLERDWEDLERATAQTAAQHMVPFVAYKTKALSLNFVTILIWASRPVSHALTARLPR